MCDNGEAEQASSLCKQYNLPVNVGAFSDSDFMDSHPEEWIAQHRAYRGIEILSMHGPFTDLCPGSKDALIRSATMARFEYAYQISRRLKCSHIILYHGYVPGTSVPSNWVKRAKIFFDVFLQNKDPNTVFYLENHLEHTPDLIAEVVYAVGDGRLKICLDVGHANCHSKTPVVEWVKALDRQIGFVHLHNNNGLADEHRGFTGGTIDLLKVFQALETYAPNAIWGIETNDWNDAEQSLLWLMEHNFLYLP